MKKAPLGVLFLLTKSAVSILPPVSGGQPMAVPTMSAIGIVPAVRAHHRAYRPNLMPLGIVRQDGKSSGMVSCTGQEHLVCTAQTEPGLALRAARQGVKGLTPATFGSFPSPGKELLGLGGRSHTGIDHCHKDVIRKGKEKYFAVSMQSSVSDAGRRRSASPTVPDGCIPLFFSI